MLAAAYPAGTFVGALPGGWLTARIGVRPTVVLGLSTLILSSLAFAFANSIVVLDVARFVQGLGGAASWAGAVGWLVGAAPRERRGELIGSAMAAAIVGALGGPVLGAAAVAVGPEVVFSGVALAGVGLLAWALRTPARPPRSAADDRTVLAALREPRIATGMWLVILVGLMFGTLDVLAPLRLDELGASAAAIGATFLVAAALEAGESPYIGRLVGPARTGAAGVRRSRRRGRDGRAAAVAGGDLAAGRRRARRRSLHRDPVDAVDGDAVRRRRRPGASSRGTRSRSSTWRGRPGRPWARRAARASARPTATRCPTSPWPGCAP